MKNNLKFQSNYDVKQLNEAMQKERGKWMWIILFGCFLLQMLPYCVALNLTSVLVPGDWAYWTKGTQTISSLTFTVGAVAAAIVGPMIAKLFRMKINMKVVYSIGIVSAMIGFAGSSLNSIFNSNPNANTIPATAAILWTSNIISQIGVMIFSGLGVNNLISRWWPDSKRGFALGIAFSGGSVGNIWMQQLLGELAKQFGNNSPMGADNLRYPTYLIMASIGLVFGIIIVLFICRKPLPVVQLTTFDTKQNNMNQVKPTTEITDVSFLQTKRYPFYWILAVGYLILQMGTVHAATNGLFVSYALVPNNPGWTPNEVLRNGGTIFAVCCLVGNLAGGVINDKIGPSKSIFLAGSVQAIAIFLLMLSTKTPSVVYGYFALAGLSVYVYTSTPAFTCGRLYGGKQSNSHMAILGIFIALGFAISNSVTGALTGTVGPNGSGELFGLPTQGNYLALGVFAIVCMILGTIIVSFSAWIIERKTIKGLAQYCPGKFNSLINKKYGLRIWYYSNKIIFKKYDFRKNSEKWNNMILEKNKKLCVLYQNDLILDNEGKQIKLNDIEFKKLCKQNKLYAKIIKITNAPVDKTKIKKYQDKSAKLLAKLQQQKNKLNNSLKNISCDWTKFKKEYYFNEKVDYALYLENKLQVQKQNMIAELNKKIMIANYIAGFETKQAIDSYDKLFNYYKQPYTVYNDLITEKTKFNLNKKYDLVKNKQNQAINKLNKSINSKKLKIDSDNKKISELNDQNAINAINQKISKYESDIKNLENKIVQINNDNTKLLKINEQYQKIFNEPIRNEI